MGDTPLLGGATFTPYAGLTHASVSFASLHELEAARKRIKQLEDELKQKDGELRTLRAANDIKIAPPTKCPKCGSQLTCTYYPAEQEYPGASWTQAYNWEECTECDYTLHSVDHDSGFEPQENKRGW